jgi:hypothetical protein
MGRGHIFSLDEMQSRTGDKKEVLCSDESCSAEGEEEENLVKWMSMRGS